MTEHGTFLAEEVMSIHIMLYIERGKDGHIDGACMGSSGCKYFHSEPSLFIYITLLNKSQTNRVVYPFEVKQL